VGPQAAHDFEARVFREFIDGEDVARIASLGFNVMRVPVGSRTLEDGGWEAVDRLLDAAERNGVYVVLDLHGAPGGQSPYFIADPRLER
jgi:aryl-phospho-beta-D-glucosidase BglC (GH1 family)